ncbi:MAG: hypothetical protein IPL61_35700 [Myxococcales bacterium]|nr:hypothetical protein [Myxococcales bacterium]
MPPSWSLRLKSTLRRPPRVSVGRFLAAQRAGEIAIEDEFFWQLQLASGVFKATNQHRFDDTFDLIRRAIPPELTQLRILDVACSSGISTVELHRALARPGLVIETVGTDIATKVMHATTGHGDALVYDLAGNILGAEIDGMLINRRPNRAVRIQHPWRTYRARRLVARHERGGAFRPGAGATVSEVPLVSSAVARTPGVTIVEEDILRPQVVGTFDLIRAANVLNRGYFSEERLRSFVTALLTRVRAGALLFVVRTTDKINHGTLWRVTDTGVTAIDRVGDGSDIGALVEDAARTSGTRRADAQEG